MRINLKINKKLIVVSFLILMILSSVSFARKIGEFSDFRITSRGQRTGYLLKEGASSSNYVLNLTPCRELKPIKVKHYLVNTSGNRRSDYHLLTCGDRWNYSNWASKNYSYALNMSRENWWDGAIAITGSWSPDQ